MHTPTLKVRPAVKDVELPGGSVVRVRRLSLAALDRIDAAAASAPEGNERYVRTVKLAVAAGLVDHDAQPLYADPESDAALVDVAEALDPEQLQAVANVALGASVAEAKNG